jgi:hypothetical protein
MSMSPSLVTWAQKARQVAWHWIFQKQLYEQSVHCDQQSAGMSSVDARAENPVFHCEGLPAERINTETEVVMGLQVKITVCCDATPSNLAYTHESHSKRVASIYRVKEKVQFTVEQATKAQRSSDIDLLFL